jgi:hypothetical protein
MSGTAMPVWSGDKSRMWTPGLMPGATRMPAASTALTTPSAPRAVPLASSAAVSTTSV